MFRLLSAVLLIASLCATGYDKLRQRHRRALHYVTARASLPLPCEITSYSCHKTILSLLQRIARPIVMTDNDTYQNLSMNGNDSPKIIGLLEGQVQDLRESTTARFSR